MNNIGSFKRTNRPWLFQPKAMVVFTPDYEVEEIYPVVNTDAEYERVMEKMAPLLREAVVPCVRSSS